MSECECVCVCVWGGGGGAFLNSNNDTSCPLSQILSCTHTPDISISSPAMNDHGSSLLWVVSAHSLPEGEEGGGVLGYTVIRPHQEVELTYLTYRHLGTTLTGKLLGCRRIGI